MDGLSACGFVVRLPPLVHKSWNRGFPFSRHRPRPCVLVAASNGPELNKWDEMELEFGRLLGEDPKLTLAKIMARKEDPDVSYLDVEKSFRKNKGKLDGIMLNMPSSLHPGEEHSVQSQKPKKLLKQRELNLSRPIMGKVPKSKKDGEKNTSIGTQENHLVGSIQLRNAPSSISLRKPSVFQDDIMEVENTKLKIKPNIYLKPATSSARTYGEITLLKKPEVKHKPSKRLDENISCDKPYDRSSNGLNGVDDLNIVNGVGAVVSTEANSFVGSAEYGISNNRDEVIEGSLDGDTVSSHMSSELGSDSLVGLQPRPTHKSVQSSAANFTSKTLNENPINLKTNFSTNAALLGILHGTDNSVGEVFHSGEFEAASSSDGACRYPDGDAMYQLMEEQDPEDNDWKRAENLQKLGGRAEVELISCSSRGFMASFGLLIGFLPYRNLGAKWKFLAFESWLRRKDSNQNLEKGKMALTEEKLNELLETYESDKMKYLSSFIGQKLVVSVINADRVSRRLIFSGKPKESEELVEKKRSLMTNSISGHETLLMESSVSTAEVLTMARLSIGDIVKCCIKKFAYFGLFVEVEGVPALIYQSEISWDRTLDPSAFFKMGQVVEAKVHQLDFALKRITLSLKEVKPDPLMETFESLVECQSSLAENSESRQADLEWADIELLVRELQKIDGIDNVTKRRFFLSPASAPTFQVYMASMFDNQYKLLARHENKVQEVIVQTSLVKAQLKEAILSCTKVLQ